MGRYARTSPTWLVGVLLQLQARCSTLEARIDALAAKVASGSVW
jgi:hypothetical protein